MLKMKIKNTLAILMIAVLVFLAGCSSAEKVTVYKTAQCGCCVGYIAALDKADFAVEPNEVQDMSPIKEKYGVPADMQSCHTAVVGKYFIEGHVPLEAVHKLLEEQPDIDGIALPDMPAGSPGMPGEKTEPFVVYAVKDGKTSEFMTI